MTDSLTRRAREQRLDAGVDPQPRWAVTAYDERTVTDYETFVEREDADRRAAALRAMGLDVTVEPRS